MVCLELVLGALLVILVSCLRGVLVNRFWRPYDIGRRLRKQGVRGPESKFWSGCLDEIRSMKKDAEEIEMDIHNHDIVPRVLPHYAKWKSQYGETFFYRWGAQSRLCITDVEQVKQVLSNKFGFFTKIDTSADELAILGRGLFVTVGSDWARHRRVVSPAFTMEKLKVMTKTMASCTLSMLDSWHGRMVEAGGKQSTIEVSRQFKELTANVISHCAFGSSYMEGKEVFLAQGELLMLVLATFLNVQIPGYEYLPTKRNRQKWKLERKMRNTLMSIIEGRLNSKHLGFGNDLLGLMMESAQKQEGLRMNMDEIVDECKTFFIAGHETTSHMLTWTMFLLSTDQEWQERLRREVVDVCGTEIPCADDLSNFKLLTMVLLEALRLYTPVMVMLRKAAEDVKLGGVTIPKDTTLSLPIALIHHNKELWGSDANEFNPLRFENYGTTASAAEHPNALLAFSMGPRACVGQNFAMLEGKMAVALILQRFSFSLSPEYKHKPADMLTLQPGSGLQIVFKSLAI
ncbi:cytochrome P450 709B2-like [Iris pallida]|uniref:Cytochrome P450 709B2-like n=1 Tax=Iris pallida TaxID=29817 RepID=A0AAX6EXL0_IRIPA|nr:cytochrome P450 709B2-like [Iris pallida]